MEAGKPWKGSWENLNLEDLYNCPWFFGILSEEKAKEILEEAMQNAPYYLKNALLKALQLIKTTNP